MSIYFILLSWFKCFMWKSFWNLVWSLLNICKSQCVPNLLTTAKPSVLSLSARWVPCFAILNSVCKPLTCEMPISTFETRSRFLPPYHVVRDRDRDFYLPIMWFEIEIFEIEIFHHWISCFETRSRFFIIESRSSRRDREFSSLNLEIRDEIEMLFISFVNKFQTPEQRAENDISLKKMCIQR